MKAVRHSFPAFCAALLAVLLQVAAMLPARAAPGPALAQAHICGQPSRDGAPSHAPMDCLHCAVCAGVLAAHAVLAPAPPGLPMPTDWVAVARGRPAGLAPPHRPATASAEPRGPPRLT